MFDVFEAHFNYITQFFVSFNLFGMNFVCLDKVWPREGVDLQAIGDHYAGIHFPRQRQTNCDLEMDCIGSCITNTRESAGDLNPGLRLIWNEEIERRVQKVQSVEELFKDIIDDSVRTSKRNQLEKDYISSLRAFLFRSNSQELSQTLISKAYYSMSQTWQIQNSNRLNSEQPNADKQNHLSQVLLRSFEDPHSICTQEVIDLIKCSQNLLVDEELMQHLLDDESEPEDVEENQNEENDEEKLETTKSQNRVSQLRLEHRKKSQPYEEIPINDSIMINSNGYNLNSESIIRTPGLSSVPFSFTAPEESAIYSDDVPLPNHSCASNEIDLFDDDERPGSKCASSPVLNDELDSDLIRTNAVDLELNLFDSSEVTLLECQSPALRSSPTSLFASSDKRCGSAAIESPSLFSFYLSESQPDSSLPTGTPTIGVKRRRLLSAPTTMQNSTTRCSTPFGDPLRSSSQNHEFVHQIRHLMQNSSEEKTANHEYQNLTIMSMELFALTDNPIKPDPNLDSIKIIFFQIYWDRPATASNCGKNDLTGVILCESDVDQLDLTFNPSTAAASACGHKKNLLESCGIDCSDLKVRSVTTELQLIESLLETVHCYDPEVLIGFEIETSSWGYLIARAGQLGIDCAKAFSRLSSTALIEEEMQFEKRWQRLQTVHPQPNQSTASSTSSSFLRSDAGIKSNNYLRRPVDSNLVEKPQKVWQKIDEFKRNLENGGESQAPASQNDGQLERDIENFFSLSYVSPCYMNFTGRIMLNLWRLMRKEVALTSYTYESLCLHVLARRVPHYSSRQLNQWFTSADSRNRWRVIDYFLSRARTNIELINKADVIGRNSELARVFGIQFSDVISKGTQFRVESLLYRSAIKQNDSFEPSEHDRAQNFMLLSCDFKKRARQHDPFMIPFVMDPIVGFYTDPVAVLDFQSLYPSIMIAHNYCYSTCVGRLESLLEYVLFE